MTDLHTLQIDEFLAQAETLTELCTHPGWGVWESLLLDMRAAALESLAQASADDFRYWQGVAAALQVVLERPGQVGATADTIRAAEEADGRGMRPELRATIGLGADHDGDI